MKEKNISAKTQEFLDRAENHGLKLQPFIQKYGLAFTLTILRFALGKTKETTVPYPKIIHADPFTVHSPKIYLDDIRKAGLEIESEWDENYVDEDTSEFVETTRFVLRQISF